MYRQTVNQYNEALKHCDLYIDQLLSEQAIELSEIMNNFDAIVYNLQNPSKLAKYKTHIYNFLYL